MCGAWSEGRIAAIAVIVIILLIVAGVAVNRWIDSEPSSPPYEVLGGAVLFADIGGDTDYRDVQRSDEQVPLHGLRMPAEELLPGPDSTFYILAFNTLAQVDQDGQVIEFTGGPLQLERVASAIDGRVAVAYTYDDAPRHVSWLDRFTESLIPDDEWPVDMETDYVYQQFDVLAVAPDDSILFSYTIEAVASDGTQTRLLGPPGDGMAQANGPRAFELIAGVVPLSDGRVAFVGDPGDGNKLYMIEEDFEVHPIETDQPIPLDGPYIGTVLVSWKIDHLTAGPNDTLIATGLGPAGHPVVTQVDPATGHATTLTELEGANVNSDTSLDPFTAGMPYMVSTAAVGDDLYILTDNKIWRLEDAFTE